jgi:hypothetical protein
MNDPEGARQLFGAYQQVHGGIVPLTGPRGAEEAIRLDPSDVAALNNFASFLKFALNDYDAVRPETSPPRVRAEC